MIDLLRLYNRQTMDAFIPQFKFGYVLLAAGLVCTMTRHWLLVLMS